MSEHETPDVSTDLTQLVESMAQVAEVLKAVADAATGYRRHLIEAGWATPAPADEDRRAAILAAGITRLWELFDEDRSRLRGAVHAMLQAFEAAGPPVDGPNGLATRSIWIPQSMVEGWRLIAEGGA